MINWINFLHFYQPPNSSVQEVQKITTECYQPWADFLDCRRDLHVTINFTACLAQALAQIGQQKLLNRFAKAAARGQIEFFDSAAFHPILPLMPKDEINRQICINRDINQKLFGHAYQPQGFYLPEMAYDYGTAQIIKKHGYQYIILDQIAFDGTLSTKIDGQLKYKIKNIGLGVIFRQRAMSRSLVPQTIEQQIIGKEKNEEQNLITATDGELYGHHYLDWLPIYERLLARKSIRTMTIAEYWQKLSAEKTVAPKKCSWESTQAELKKGQPYILWQNPKNKIQKYLWQLTYLALDLVNGRPNDSNHYAARLHLERGLASCTFWWASKKDFQLFSAIAWHPEMVEKGARDLLNAIRSLEKVSKAEKIKAEKKFTKIRELIWTTHWQ
ncbi:hypothetical protein COU23_00870 [Candidatus Kuenenbacteria bacterium CG10_big_fil_rev_8_21_14_0_10_36_11]|uniref:Glycoside hydrolase family 57 N-terminal domain-containing protein n=1 Tax=Candidatus Kuenenbacteria bacterium CG10_big_fil_rev_8_21_14_0_10_36_11 TaxID=1974618 RepID=A0A2M6WB63_9BACT|nr:MAG: hypothetical protein COU23_00870 [Candidatus Kuenenbacteria bacterium CG10_big_fil_rev_8_21_14_0_10_36_11]